MFKKYRKAIGIIILNTENKIICFRRNDFPESWQGPEGGIEDNEDLYEAMKREVFEEVGLEEKDYILLKKSSKSFFYDFKNKKKCFGFDGQEKIFFLIKLKNKVNFNFHILPNEIEFSESKILDKADDLLNIVPSFKKEMYESVLKDFKII